MLYINSYSYKPEFVFHKVCNEDDLYMGVELEVDMGGESEENAKGVLDILNGNGESNAYCMHDGSLTGGCNRFNYSTGGVTGFEIATMPCTLEYHKTLPYEEAFKFLVDKGYKSHDTKTCGMHVHVNRTFFGADKLTQDLNISKLMFLFEKYWNDVVVIARRDSNTYARRSFLEDDESVIDLYSKSKSKGKYAVINLEHKDAVEIRIFKGTLNSNTYMCTLEFVYKICQIVKKVDIYNIQMVKWSDIESTFSEDLKNYIDERKEIEKNKKKEESEKLNNQEITISQNGIYAENILGSFHISSNNITFSNGSILGYDSSRVADTFCTINQRMSEIIETPTEDSMEDTLRKKIKNIKKQINRARNELEKLNLRRSLAELENELAIWLR